MTDRFYRQVPRTLKENLGYRRNLLQRCARDEKFRRATLEACKHDILFWYAAFTWLYEPRPKTVNGVLQPSVIPFIPWEHQEPIITSLEENLGLLDVGVEKSRGEGMSWIAVLKALRDWTFHPLAKIGLVSRNEDAADNPNDPDSLMWKVDWELTKLPVWMVGKKDVDYRRNLVDHALVNLRSGAVISAYSAVAHVGRGGRYRWFMMDELGSFRRGDDARAVQSTQHATNSRLFISTPEGSEGAYYDVMHTPSSMVKLTLHWSQNSSRNRGLYKLERGKLVEHDPVGNPLPPGYRDAAPEIFSKLRQRGYNLEAGWRSPWYDNECLRPGATPQNIAQELDLDYGGSRHLIFPSDFTTVVNEMVRVPLLTGQFDLHPETLEVSFGRLTDGPVKLWCPLSLKGYPPDGSYVIGVDVSSGLGGSYTSNSVCQVLNMDTGEHALEWATNVVSPSDFADFCIGIAHWFHGAYLAWEINGPGSAFTRRVLDRHYGNIFKRTVLWRSARKKTMEVGWHTADKSKEVMFSDILSMVRSRQFTVRSKMLASEFRQYIREGTKIEHQSAARTQDGSSKGSAHGDRVIAFGVALQGAKDRISEGSSRQQKQHTMEDPPPGSMAHRLREFEAQENSDSDWDDRSNMDLRSRSFPGHGRVHAFAG